MNVDWQALNRLRTAFLDGTAGSQDYWHSETDLASYDQTFGQRIAWKWDYVLDELTRRQWTPPGGTVLDWGCGTGVASRAFLRHFGTQALTKLYLSDRSPLAMQFAAQNCRGVPVWLETKPAAADVVLLSHVLTELAPVALGELLALVRQATAVIWVEPGTLAVSRQLIAIREQLREDEQAGRLFNVVAPCPHQTACGMLAAGNERHWCHQFAPPPPAVFTDGDWARFGKLAGIDLRSLPVSFLVLDKRTVAPTDRPRVMGRARVYKAHALVLECSATGVQERQVLKRTAPELFRQLKKKGIP
jgi:SAM-dependent methyltransferase